MKSNNNNNTTENNNFNNYKINNYKKNNSHVDIGMKRYDLHGHSYYSKCSNLKPKIILKRAKKRGLNGLAVTDHNTIKGAVETKKLNKDPNFEVIIGEEVMTNKGEVLALYINEEIKPGKFEDVIKEIKQQGGISILAHPFSMVGLQRKRASGNIYDKVDAIEGFNARSFFKFENYEAQIKAKEIDKPITAGSDYHFWFEVGRAYTMFEGDLKTAIKEHKTNIRGSNLFAIPARIITFFQKYIISALKNYK